MNKLTAEVLAGTAALWTPAQEWLPFLGKVTHIPPKSLHIVNCLHFFS